MTIIWCMLPEIWSVTYNFLLFWTIFCTFSPLTTRKIKILKKWKKNNGRYYHITHVYLKWQSYDVWFLRYEAWQIEFFIMNHFLPFYPPNNPKNQNFEKMIRMPGYIMIICYAVCEIWRVTDVIVVFHFGLFFALLPPKRTKNQKFKKGKKYLEISSFYNSVPKIMIICYTVPEIWYMTDIIIFHFGPFFALLPP